MGSIQFTPADRDASGFVSVAPPAAEPRSLADLLPKPETVKQDAKPLKLTRQELVTLGIVALLAVVIMAYAWSTERPQPAPAPRPAAPPTAIATVAPTLAPTAAGTALVGYFDYRDPATAAPITSNQITRVIGTAGDAWRLVDVGNARVWIPADAVPTGIPAADPLPDLAPRRPAPAPASAPVAAPAAAPVVAPAPCTQDTAPYVVHRQVEVGGLPIGSATGWSCVSAADAEASASAQEQQVRANYAATAAAGR